MNKNVGTIDMIVRLILAAIIIIFGVYFKSYLGLLAIIPLFTALIGWCPLYPLFGFSTCKKKD